MKPSLRTLKLQPLTEKKFAPFGEVISIENKPYVLINNGYTKKYTDLVNIDTPFLNGRTAVHFFVGIKRPFPLHIDMLEKHPFFSQAFIPQSNRPFIIVVAKGGAKPNEESIESFITDGKQGINFHRNTWHYPLISSHDNETFIVIDRADTTTISLPEQNCVEYYFETPNCKLSHDCISA